MVAVVEVEGGRRRVQVRVWVQDGFVPPAPTLATENMLRYALTLVLYHLPLSTM